MALHVNGLGEALGDTLVVSPGGPVYQDTGDVWFVDSTTGDDSYSGKDQKQPFATLGQAVTSAGTHDIIVLMDGHTETITSTVTVSTAGLTIVGGGQSSGKPTVKLTNQQESASMLVLSGLGVQLRNVWIEEESSAQSAVTVSVTGDSCSMRGIYWELDEATNAAGLDLALALGESFSIRNSTFVSTATSAADPPQAAIRNSGDGLLRMDGVTLDGGTVGFVNGYAYSESNSSTGFTQGFQVDSISLLNGADMNVHASTVGYIQVSSDSDDPRIDWVETGP